MELKNLKCSSEEEGLIFMSLTICLEKLLENFGVSKYQHPCMVYSIGLFGNLLRASERSASLQRTQVFKNENMQYKAIHLNLLHSN